MLCEAVNGYSFGVELWPSECWRMRRPWIIGYCWSQRKISLIENMRSCGYFSNVHCLQCHFAGFASTFRCFWLKSSHLFIRMFSLSCQFYLYWLQSAATILDEIQMHKELRVIFVLFFFWNLIRTWMILQGILLLNNSKELCFFFYPVLYVRLWFILKNTPEFYFTSSLERFDG